MGVNPNDLYPPYTPSAEEDVKVVGFREGFAGMFQFDLVNVTTPEMPDVGTPGESGGASQTLVITTDSKGRVTVKNPVAIAIAQSQVTNLTTDLATKANLSSPALTGVPTAPTAAPGTNTAQIATAAFVKAAVDAILDAPPGALDTLNELAAALNDDPSFAATVTTSLAAKLSTVTLTGDVTGSGGASFPTTLATVNGSVGTFGTTDKVARITADAKGRATALVELFIDLSGAYVLDVHDPRFGAVGDGDLNANTGTDDRAAIQAAIDYYASTPTINKGRAVVVKLRALDYALETGPLFIDRGYRVYLMGQGKHATRIFMKNNAYMDSPVVIAGVPRADYFYNTQLDSTYRVDLSTVPGMTVTAATRYGPRTKASAVPVFKGTPLDHGPKIGGGPASPDQWRTLRHWTMDIAVYKNGADWVTGDSPYGMYDVYAPGSNKYGEVGNLWLDWRVREEEGGAAQLCYSIRTADGLHRRFFFPDVPASDRLTKLSVEPDLENGTFYAWYDGTQIEVDFTYAGDDFLAETAPATPNPLFPVGGHWVKPNVYGFVQLGNANDGSGAHPSQHSGGEVSRTPKGDFTVCGLRMSTGTVWANDGEGQPQVRETGGTPFADSDYWSAAPGSATFFRLTFQDVFDEDNILVRWVNDRDARFGAGLFVRDVITGASPPNLNNGYRSASGMGGVIGLELSGGYYGYNVMLGNTLSFTMKDVRTNYGAYGFGHLPFAVSYPIMIVDCEFYGAGDACCYFYRCDATVFSPDHQTVFNNGRFAVLTMNSTVTVQQFFVADSSNTQSPFYGDGSNVYAMDGLMDFEREGVNPTDYYFDFGNGTEGSTCTVVIRNITTVYMGEVTNPIINLRSDWAMGYRAGIGTDNLGGKQSTLILDNFNAFAGATAGAVVGVDGFHWVVLHHSTPPTDVENIPLFATSTVSPAQAIRVGPYYDAAIPEAADPADPTDLASLSVPIMHRFKASNFRASEGASDGDTITGNWEAEGATTTATLTGSGTLKFRAGDGTNGLNGFDCVDTDDADVDGVWFADTTNLGTSGFVTSFAVVVPRSNGLAPFAAGGNFGQPYIGGSDLTNDAPVVIGFRWYGRRRETWVNGRLWRYQTGLFGVAQNQIALLAGNILGAFAWRGKLSDVIFYDGKLTDQEVVDASLMLCAEYRVQGPLGAAPAPYPYLRPARGLLDVSSATVEFPAKAVDIPRITEPAAPGSDIGRVFVRDNGSGKDQLCVLFASGAVQVIATEP